MKKTETEPLRLRHKGAYNEIHSIVSDGQTILCFFVKIDWDKMAMIKTDSKIKFRG